MSNKNIPRLFINKELKFDIKIILEKNDKHYLKNVLRLDQDNVVHILMVYKGNGQQQ